MAPTPRKRMRPNPAEASASSTSLPVPPTNPATTTSPAPAPPVLDTSAGQGERGSAGSESLLKGQKQVRKSKSWYGSWPRASKSTAATPQLAHETILGGTLKPSSSSDLRRFDSKKSTDGSSFDGAESQHTLPQIPETDQAPTPDAPDASTEVAPQVAADASTERSQTTKDFGPSATPESPVSPQRPATSSGWLGWLGRSPAPPAKPSAPSEPPVERQPEMPESKKDEQKESPNTANDQSEEPSTPTRKQSSETPKTDLQTPAYSTYSWFGLWATTPQTATQTANTEEAPQTPTVAKKSDNAETEDTAMTDAPPPEPPVKSPPPTAGSTWAFWSRDVRPSTPSGGSTLQRRESGSGELAIMGEGSEAHPEPSLGMDVATSESGKEDKASKTKKDVATQAKKNKRLRPQSMDLDESATSSGTSTPRPTTTVTTLDSAKNAETSKQAAAPEATTKPNLLLPSFDTTYKMKDNPSIIKQITQLLLRTQQPPANHVFRVKETPKIRKAIAIGVHGLFPATYLRPMVGQPTGTSLRFANHCAEGIRRWADAHGCADCEIEKVALEGEGKIMERVDNLWKLLLNWIEQIRSADLILLACHSQGVPVAIMLLGKLIDLGIITNARIGVCAMAGVNLGPFPDYKSSMGMLMGTAAELWEFSNPDSDISQRYEAALKEVLEYGGRITFVGSIDDQLVPMESSVFSPASHPYIYRAVFIDGRIHAPDFIAHLVGFALKLRNLGISDHGLVRELSTPLAGSLYSGEGHSRLYYDDQIYDLAVAHALETTDIAPHTPNRKCEVHRPHRPVTPSASNASTTGGSSSTKTTPAQANVPLTNPNPYHLPWIMRGLLEEDFVKTELSSETEELLRQFDDWKPSTKALKDVKYRLEAVRSKL